MRRYRKTIETVEYSIDCALTGGEVVVIVPAKRKNWFLHLCQQYCHENKIPFTITSAHSEAILTVDGKGTLRVQTPDPNKLLGLHPDRIVREDLIEEVRI